MNYFILLKAYSPGNRKWVTSGLFIGSNLTQVTYNQHLDYLEYMQYKKGTLHKHKIYQHNPKVSPFGIALVKKWQIKLGDAGTIDHFDLAFQYQIVCFTA